MSYGMKLLVSHGANAWGLSVSLLLGEQKRRVISRPRQIIMWYGSRVYGLSYPEIGRGLGGRDHTTILHGTKCIAELIAARDPQTLDLIAAFEKDRPRSLWALSHLTAPNMTAAVNGKVNPVVEPMATDWKMEIRNDPTVPYIFDEVTPRAYLEPRPITLPRYTASPIKRATPVHGPVEVGRGNRMAGR